MTEISLLFVRKFVNSSLLTAFPASISKISAHFSFAPVSCKGLILLLCLLSPIGQSLADEVYQKPRDFIKEVFAGVSPLSHTLWVTKDRRQTVEEILGERPRSLRVRFWEYGARSAWILDATGKDHPITAGIVVNQGKIERVKILIFRESRGWEVRHAFFTDQFIDAKITKEHVLTKDIDGISGATLSVRAVTAMARLALYYSNEIKKQL
ncbi:MAG: FMN-binding protein [Gammaproteobacteria bacterium]|nr:FMN-binding protein [Gammaproteobacteria bacterium]